VSLQAEKDTNALSKGTESRDVGRSSLDRHRRHADRRRESHEHDQRRQAHRRQEIVVSAGDEIALQAGSASLTRKKNGDIAVNGGRSSRDERRAALRRRQKLPTAISP
jgi:hypothetical protein